MTVYRELSYRRADLYRHESGADRSTGRKLNANWSVPLRRCSLRNKWTIGPGYLLSLLHVPACYRFVFRHERIGADRESSDPQRSRVNQGIRIVARQPTRILFEVRISGVRKFADIPSVRRVRLGALDSVEGAKSVAHIWIGSKSDWFEITDSLEQFKEEPPDSYCASG